MDAATFERRLYAWLDGELPAAEAAEMDAWCTAHPAARERVAAERAFDDRVRAALVGDPSAQAVVGRALAALRATEPAPGTRTPSPAQTSSPQPPSAPPRPAGRVFRMPRWIPAALAASVLVVATMWFQCIPPFQCGVVEALEKAAEVAETAPCGNGAGCPITARMRVAAAQLGAEVGDPARVPVACCPGCTGTGFRIRRDGAEAVCVWSPCKGCVPSFRNEAEVGGAPAWVARHHGRGVVVFRDAATGDICSLVGTAPDDTLTALAKDLRAALTH